MLRRFLRWLTGTAGDRPRRPRRRLTGCLFWIVVLALVILILSLMFGGFRKGTKVGGAANPGRHQQGRVAVEVAAGWRPSEA
jgi:hypothetical protein